MFEIRVLQGVCSGEASLSGLWLASFWLCPLVAVPRCVCRGAEPALASLPLRRIESGYGSTL